MKLSINVSLNTKYVYLIKLHPVVMQVLTNCVFPSDSMGSCLYLNYFLFKTTPFPPLHWGVHMAPQLLGLFSRVLNLIIVHVWDHVQISIFSKNIRVGWCGARGICDRVMRVLNTQFFSDHSTMLLPSKQQRILKKKNFFCVTTAVHWQLRHFHVKYLIYLKVFNTQVWYFSKSLTKYKIIWFILKLPI
jgi:hypothetical protein